MLDNGMAREKALYDGHAVAAVAATSAGDRPQGAEAHRGRLRGAAACDRCRRGDEARMPPSCTTRMFTEGVEPKPKKPSNVAKRSEFGHGDPAGGFAEADCRRRAHLQDRADAPGLYRAACLRGQRLRSDGTGRALGLHAGPFHGPQHCAELLGMDVSKLRVTSSEIGGGFGGKTTVLGRAGRAGAVAQGRPAGQAGDDARRGVPRLGPDQRHLDRRQDRRHARTARSPRPRRRCAIQGGPFAGTLGRARRHDRVRLLQARERPDGRLRSAGQPAEDGGLSRAVGADGGVRGGKRGRRAGAEDRHGSDRVPASRTPRRKAPDPPTARSTARSASARRSRRRRTIRT